MAAVEAACTEQQTWSDARKIRTRGTFDIAERSGYFHEGGTKWVEQRGRCAQIYVFAWNSVYGQEADHRDPTQWEFCVLPTAVLPEARRQSHLLGPSHFLSHTERKNIARLAERIEQVTPRREMAVG